MPLPKPTIEDDLNNIVVILESMNHTLDELCGEIDKLEQKTSGVFEFKEALMALAKTLDKLAQATDNMLKLG